MLKVYSDCFQLVRFPPSWTVAKIVLINKVGKDPTLPQSYQPISLLNTDYKIFTIVIATRLN